MTQQDVLINDEIDESPPPRRSFLRKLSAGVLGLIAVGGPLATGLAAFFTPLGRKAKKADFINVTPLDALPDDGMPHRFEVLADKGNAWTMERNVPIGSVYLKRTGTKVIAWNTTCPHLGCAVDALADGSFICPCHNSKFAPDGALGAGSVSPRGLDTLEVDEAALANGQVRVRYQNFVASTHQKIAQS